MEGLGSLRATNWIESSDIQELWKGFLRRKGIILDCSMGQSEGRAMSVKTFTIPEGTLQISLAKPEMSSQHQETGRVKQPLGHDVAKDSSSLFLGNVSGRLHVCLVLVLLVERWQLNFQPWNDFIIGSSKELSRDLWEVPGGLPWGEHAGYRLVSAVNH